MGQWLDNARTYLVRERNSTLRPVGALLLCASILLLVGSGYTVATGFESFLRVLLDYAVICLGLSLGAGVSPSTCRPNGPG
ncbi:hypothetical protein BH18ACT10_BH18ACT10_09820 [soil metagenome]